MHTIYGMKYINLYLIPMFLTGALIVLCSPGMESDRVQAGPAIKAVCDDIQRRFDQILAGAGCTCRKNADCGCYNPVSRKAGCGGVTDKKSADRLMKLEKEFHHAGCNWPVQCAAWFCRPVCVNGRCMKG